MDVIGTSRIDLNTNANAGTVQPVKALGPETSTHGQPAVGSNEWKAERQRAQALQQPIIAPDDLIGGPLKLGAKGVAAGAGAVMGAMKSVGAKESGVLLREGANKAAPFSHLVNGGGLAAHEAAGGHLLLKHVGQSESALAARLAAEPRLPAASTFVTRAEAEAAVNTVLNAEATRLSTWVSSGARGQLVLNAPFNGGLVLQRGASTPASGTGATVVLRGTGGGNWRVVTGYPTP